MQHDHCAVSGKDTTTDRSIRQVDRNRPAEEGRLTQNTWRRQDVVSLDADEVHLVHHRMEVLSEWTGCLHVLYVTRGRFHYW